MSKGYFILGDSAYAIESFIIPPYALTEVRTSQDDFNLFHSSARITVECAFGEINMRWGIFWKPLRCSVDNATVIIEGAMRLHNFLVECRDENLTPLDISVKQRIFNDDCINMGAYPIISGNDGTRPVGRPRVEEREYRLQGLKLRDNLRLDIAGCDMHRPRQEEWEYNKNGGAVRIDM